MTTLHSLLADARRLPAPRADQQPAPWRPRTAVLAVLAALALALPARAQNNNGPWTADGARGPIGLPLRPNRFRRGGTRHGGAVR
jgi:hypothetical protein